MESKVFCNVRFDNYCLSQLSDHLFEMGNKLTILVTPNVDHVVRANNNTSFRDLYAKADISVNDSRVLLKLCKLIGIDLGCVIPGSDLTKNIIRRISNTETAITVIGCTSDTINRVSNKYSLSNVAHYNPPMGFINNEDEVDKCINFILDNPSQFIFLAVGSPRQEIIAQKAKEAGAIGVALCIGASFMFLSGEEKRAPKLFQQLSIEWLFRLMQSPKRLAKRYLVDGMEIFPILIKEYLKRKRKTPNNL